MTKDFFVSRQINCLTIAAFFVIIFYLCKAIKKGMELPCYKPLFI